MAEVSPKVMQMVEAEIRKNPDVANAELFEKAKGLDKGVASLNARQFNARYPLQVKRAMAPKKRRARKPAGGKKAGGKKAAGKKAAGKKATGKRATRKPASRKAGGRKAAAPKPAGRKKAGRKPAAGKAAGGRRAGRGRAGRGAAAAGNDRVRKILLGLARDVANAQGTGDVVDVVAGIDRYVDRVVKATR